MQQEQLAAVAASRLTHRKCRSSRERQKRTGTMRGAAIVIVALCAVGALADEPKKKKNAKPKKEKKDAKKDCPACPADLSDELKAATQRAEKAEAKTCPEDLSEALAAAEARAKAAEEQVEERDKVLREEMDKAAEAKKDAKHWKAQVDGLEEALQSTKAALATSHAEPVVPGVSISNDGTCLLYTSPSPRD